jgi:hypothetical protein
MADNKVDLGNLKSRDVGNLISKQLVELGKNEVRHGAPEDSVDYGDLPSKTLPELGKKAVANAIKQDGATLR